MMAATCILPFPVEFPELLAGKREEGEILHGYLAILCGKAEFPFPPAGRSGKFYKERGISKTPKSTGSQVTYNKFCTSSSHDGG